MCSFGKTLFIQSNAHTSNFFLFTFLLLSMILFDFGHFLVPSISLSIFYDYYLLKGLSNKNNHFYMYNCIYVSFTYNHYFML